MPDLFVDTSGWAAIIDNGEPFHTQGISIYRQARQSRRPIITTNYVMTELVALLTRPIRLPRQDIIDFVEGIRTSPYLEIVHIDSLLDAQAWELLKNRRDKNWSMVDCVSFTLMTQKGMTEALTTDHHFEQAGFVRLLK